MIDAKSVQAIAVLGLLIVPIPAGLMGSASSSTSIASAEWTDHEVIVINSDTMFTAENGVVGGTGMKSDPYIIEGWRIGPFHNRTAILIQGTTAYFTVRDVYVFSCSIGVFMHTVHNGRVETSQLNNDEVGVAAYESDNCKITDNVFENCSIAISLSFSDVSQSDNTFVSNDANVVKYKPDTPPWEQTWLGAAVCVAIFIPLAVVIATLVYFRVKRPQPPSS